MIIVCWRSAWVLSLCTAWPVHGLSYYYSSTSPSLAKTTTRRDVINHSIWWGLCTSGRSEASYASDASSLPGDVFQTYQVLPDASAALNPQLQQLQSSSFLDKIASTQKGGAIWLGEHHNSRPDHILQATIFERLRTRRRPELPLALGLEQIQIQFQPVLDEYTAGKLSSTDLRRLVEWDQRWTWPFEIYEPIFEKARDVKASLIALNVNSEDLEFVERLGLPGLPPDRMREYIGDPSGFAAFARPHQFSTYVDYVIAPSYQLHQDMGLLKQTMSGVQLDDTMSFRKFLSGRMLWDESMAWHAYKWTAQNPGGLLVGLVGADHVKFRHGIPGRFARLVDGKSDCVSVLLNPTQVDARPSSVIATSPDAITSQRPELITLQLSYVEDSKVGVLPLADYVIVG